MVYARRGQRARSNRDTNIAEFLHVPLVVTRYSPSTQKVEMVKGLNANDVKVQMANTPGEATDIGIDDGPKRVAIVLDGSDSVPDDEWKLETQMAAILIGNARPDDRFLIVLVGQDGATDGEMPSSSAQERLTQLAKDRPAPGAAERTYDALLSAAQRLEPSAFGDAVFLFGHPDDSGSKASADQLREFLMRNLVRFYAISFTDPLKAKLPPNFDLNKPLPASIKFPELTRISADTGYFCSFHSIEQLQLPSQTALFEDFLGDLYMGIASPYRLTIQVAPATPSTNLEISLTKAQEPGIHQDDIHYPHVIYGCKEVARNATSTSEHTP